MMEQSRIVGSKWRMRRSMHVEKRDSLSRLVCESTRVGDPGLVEVQMMSTDLVNGDDNCCFLHSLLGTMVHRLVVLWIIRLG